MPAALLLAVLAASAARPEAPPERERPYDVGHYRVELRFAPDDTFEGRADVRLTPRRALSSVELDARGLDVTEVELPDGTRAPFTLTGESSPRAGLLTVRVPRPLPPGREATLRVRFRGQPGSAQEGLFRVELPGGARALSTDLQLPTARRLFPCNGAPGDTATSELHVVTAATDRALSNGRLLLDETFTEEGRHLRRAHWLQDRPHPAGRVGLAVGPFEEVEVRASVPAALYVPAGTSERAFFARDATSHTLAFLEERLGVRFPWDRYDQVAVPRAFRAGVGATSLGLVREDALLLAGGRVDFAHRPEQLEQVARTLATQWFGALVTAAPSDAWLHAGVTAYLAHRAADDFLGTDLAEVSRATRTLLATLPLEDGAGPRPRGPAGAPEVADAARAAAVVRMLEEWVGRDALLRGMQAYLRAHAHGVATPADFFRAVEKAAGAGKELRAFGESWRRHPGSPVLTPSTSWDGQSLTLTLTQRPHVAGERGPFVFKLPVVLHRDMAPTYHHEEVILVDRPVVKVRVELPAAPQWVNWNRDGAALVRIPSSALGEQQWARSVRSDPDPVWRVLAASALLGELAPRPEQEALPTATALAALTELLERDPSAAVREAVLLRLGEVRAPRLPGELGPAVLTLARSPAGLEEDAIGRVRVRRAALALLGRLDFPRGHASLLEQVGREDLDVNLLGGWMTGVARMGGSEALATLRAAVFTQRRRGEGHFLDAAEALAAFESPEVVPVLREVLAAAEGDAALAARLQQRLGTNRAVLASPELAGLVTDLALRPGRWGEDVRTGMVRLLEDVRTPEVRAALERIIARQAAAEQGRRLAASARQVLLRNFPVPPARTKTTRSTP